MSRRNGWLGLALLRAHPEPPAEGEDDAPSDLNLNAMAHPRPRREVYGRSAAGLNLNAMAHPRPRREVQGRSAAGLNLNAMAHPRPPREVRGRSAAGLNLNAMAHPPPRREVHRLSAVGRVQQPINSRFLAARRDVVGASSETAVAAHAALVRTLPQKRETFRVPAPKHNAGASSGSSSGSSSATKAQLGDCKAEVAAVNAGASSSVRKRAVPEDPHTLDLTLRAPPSVKKRQSRKSEHLIPTRWSERLAPFYIKKENIDEPKCNIPMLPTHSIEYTNQETNTLLSKDREEKYKLASKCIQKILGKDDVMKKWNMSTSQETTVQHVEEHISYRVQPPSPQSLYKFNLLVNVAHFQSQKEKEEEEEMKVNKMKAHYPPSKSGKRNKFMEILSLYNK